MNLETIKKSFSQIENLSNNELKDLLSDKSVLIGYNRLNRVFPSYFQTLKSLVESSKELKYIDDIMDEKFNRIGIKFKVNRKPNGIFVLKLEMENRLWLYYSMEDVEELSNKSVSNNFKNLIKEENEKPKNTIETFGGHPLSVLESINDNSVQITLGDKTLFHSNYFKEYFDVILTPYLKSISILIQKKIKEAVELNSTSDKVEITVISKYIQYDSNGEYETYTENNSHKIKIDKEVLEYWFVIESFKEDEETKEEYTVKVLEDEDDFKSYTDFGPFYTDIIDNIDYRNIIEKFYSPSDFRLRDVSIYCDGLEFNLEYNSEKKSYSFDFGKLKSDDDYLYDYYEDYVMWYKDGKWQSNNCLKK